MASGVSGNHLAFLFFFDRVWPICCIRHSYRAVLYCGAFHRIHRLLRGSGALRRGEKEVLTGSLVEKHDREGTMEPASIGIKN